MFHLFTGGYEFERETYANDNSQQYRPGRGFRHRCHAVQPLGFCAGPGAVPGRPPADFRRVPGAVLFARYAGVLSAGVGPVSGDLVSVAHVGVYRRCLRRVLFPQTGTKLRAHVGRGYRAPSLFERFGAGFDPVFGYSVYGDPRLKPEHSLGFDAGFDQTFFGGRLKTSASYFYTWLQDVINFDTSGAINPATDPFGRSIGYLNTRGGISRGVEQSAALAPTRSLRVTGAYTFVNAIERTPIVGDVLQTFVVPRNQFSVLVTEQATHGCCCPSTPSIQQLSRAHLWQTDGNADLSLRRDAQGECGRRLPDSARRVSRAPPVCAGE